MKDSYGVIEQIPGIQGRLIHSCFFKLPKYISFDLRGELDLFISAEESKTLFSSPRQLL